MTPNLSLIVLGLPGSEELAADLAASLGAQRGGLTLHRFPDQETCVRITSVVADCDVIVACSLDQPNDKLIALYLAASTLRALGARRVILVAPYLPYMRQDHSFHTGEGVSAVHIASWLSSFLDGLVTVDPHLHRIHDLGEVYRIATRVVHAAKPIASWIRENVSNAVLVGPDEESRQWVSEVAQDVPCPFFVLEKIRFGDRDVEVHMPDAAAHQDRTPVLVDDIVSSAHTMIAAVKRLQANGFGPPVCIGIHALFSQDAYEQLRHAGAQEVITCNTIRHISNGIDLNRSLALSVRGLLDHLPAKAPVVV
jgi:ribose-phosphate pyrophosphokinase